MAAQLQWGLMGPGRIAHKFAKGISETDSSTLVAVASRNQQRSDAFAAEYSITNAYSNYDALLQDREVQAVYIATPHPMHKEWVLKSAAAGKHILCEKPIALNAADTHEMLDAVKANDVFFMEAFMYRCHPQIKAALDIVHNGTLGDITLIEASFGFCADFDPSSRLFDPSLGGGGILDVGCYPASFVRAVAGAAYGTDVAEPVQLKAVGCIGETGVDEITSAVLSFEGGIIAEISTAIRLRLENTAKIVGTKGQLVLHTPWQPPVEGCHMTVHLNDQPSENIHFKTTRSHYSMEIDVVAANLDKRQAPAPAMSWADTLGNMTTLDRWRKEIGLTYPGE